MTDSSPGYVRRNLASVLCVYAFVCIGSALSVANAAPNDPVLLTEPTSTRAIALDAVTWKREPFPLSQLISFSADSRTRVMLFAMNVDLQPGEPLSVVTAEAEDAARRRYPLTVEYVGRVPGYEWMSAVVVRLNNDMGEVGDVLVRINLRNVPSNRVRIGIGRTGGGPPDDPGSVPKPAPYPAPTPSPSPTSSPTPTPSPGLTSSADAVRFLEQSTFGPTPALIARLESIGFRALLNEQFSAPVSAYPDLQPFPSNSSEGCPTGSPAGCLRDNYTMYPLQVRFFQNALTGQDQLRQRVAFSLGQIFVVSGLEIQQPSSVAPYLRLLHSGAFGNFRQLMYDVTLNPAMGRYLDMVNNDKANPRTGVEPNENYARELLQLFSIGVYKLNQDGTLQRDAQGQLIPTYDQETVEGFARSFTGWTYAPKPGQTMRAHNPEYYLVPMVSYANNHETGTKQLLDGALLPAGQTPEKDLNDAIDNIFNHPNVAPFISKQLIQHLVTSNPSPAYVNRVAAVFNNNGAGVRGDLRAVVEAVLLDAEARGDVKTDPAYGHLREPVLFVTNILRAFNATSDGLGLAEQARGMGQNLFYSPSVFNYYPPSYVVPGPNILGPEFAINSTSSALARSNFVNTIVFNRITPPSGSPAGAVGASIDLSAWQARAGDPAKLVDELDKLLMHGTMSPTTRGIITQAVTNVPSSNTLLRARTAIYLVATSSQYQVER